MTDKAKFPSTPAEVRDFIGSHFMGLKFGAETQDPHESDIYTLSAHDIASAFRWFEEYAVGAGGVQALSAAPALDERVPEAWTNLLAYVLQDDMRNRLTPRVIDIAYTAFNLAKQPNTEDGGASDWFTDTKPTVDKLIAKLRKDLIEHLSAEQQAAPKAAPGEPSDAEIDAFLDSPGGLAWVIADKRERYRLLVRAVLAKWAAPQQEPVAFIHWPVNGPPRLVWYSQKALNNAILKTHEDGYKPDVKLYSAPRPAPAPLSDDTKRLAWMADGWTPGHEKLYVQHVLETGGVGDLDDLRTFIDKQMALGAALAAQGGK